MRSQFLAITGSMVVAVSVMPAAKAQIPFLPNLQPPSGVKSDLETRIVSGWVYSGGRRLFQIAAPRANFRQRLQDIQRNLAQIKQDYLRSPDGEPNVEIRMLNGLPVIYVNDQYLLTVTDEDAKLRQLDPKTLAEQLKRELEENLIRAKLEREPEFLVGQGKIAGATVLTMIVLSAGVYYLQQRSKRHLVKPIQPTSRATEPITTQLNQQQHRNLTEVHRRLFQLTQATIWGSGTVFILGLFPYTRALQLGFIRALQVPLRLAVVLVGGYIAIRISYALIDRFTSAFVSSSALLTPETSERLQLRISTISGVSKSIVTIAWMGVGVLVTLALFGIDIIPLLAGAGLVGVAVSLASQNLIKDAINGFLIILEDQYALGDVISVGDVGGLVENLNLRMTQVRDAEGRLITIPNSEVRIVANLSSRWSRADMAIPVAYQACINQALKLIETVGLEMDADPQWQEQILETPQVLGVDNFGDRGLIIRVWIKTQPLKQWDVAREFRRRLKIAFDEAGISIPLPQQSIWVNDAHLLNPQDDGKGSYSYGRG